MGLRQAVVWWALASGLVVQGWAAQDAPNAAETPTLRTSTRLVYVDVVVRDGGGHVVHGLSAKDFHLSEDKRAQEVRFFTEHSSSTKAELPGRAEGGGGFSNVPVEAGDQTLNLVLFDLLNTDRNDQTYARERMIEFLRKLPAGKQVALFVLSDQLRMVQGVTDDSAALARAAQEIHLTQMNRTRSANEKLRQMDFEAALPARLSAAVNAEVLREDEQNAKVRLDTTNEAFRELAAAVNGYPGRKNLFWLAGQFPSSEYFRLQALSTRPAGDDFAPGAAPGGGAAQPVGTGGSNRAVGLTFGGRTDRAIADAQIAVYPVSVLGVETDSIGAEQTGLGSAGTDNVTNTAAAQFTDRQQIRSVMEHIASETGGEAFYGNNDVDRLLTRGFEDSENYYTLAYSPTDHDWNGKYRTIQVGLNGRGGSLSYRRGYIALPEQPVGNVMQQFQAAMRMESPPATMLRLRVTPSASGGTLLLDSKLDLGGVGFAAGADGKREAHLLLGLMAYPYAAAGQTPPQQTSGKLNLKLTPEQYSALLASGVAVRQTLPLRTGRYVLRVGVVDTGSGRIGTMTLPVEMP